MILWPVYSVYNVPSHLAHPLALTSAWIFGDSFFDATRRKELRITKMYDATQCPMKSRGRVGSTQSPYI